MENTKEEVIDSGRRMSCKTAAKYYSYSEGYFRKLVFEGKVSFHHLGRQVRFFKTDLDTYFEKITTLELSQDEIKKRGLKSCKTTP